MIVWILLFQGAIFSSAWGCGLEDLCRANGIKSLTVDSSSDIKVSAQCSGPDASSSSWFIQRYMNGNDSLDGLGAPLTLNDSFRTNGSRLTICQVNGFAEGTYHCGVDNNTIQPASLCLFVQGGLVFTSCPGEGEVCPIEDITGTANNSVSIDTRVTFNGGFCGRTNLIRFLSVSKDQEQVYFCSDLFAFERQLCKNNDKFRVEQQQTCNGSDITLCKYDIKLVVLDFNESDEGLYEVVIEFDDDGLEVGMLSRQFNITLLSEPSNNNSLTTRSTSFTTSSTTLTTLSDGAISGIVVPIILLVILIPAATLCAFCYYKRKKKKKSEAIRMSDLSRTPPSPDKDPSAASSETSSSSSSSETSSSSSSSSSPSEQETQDEATLEQPTLPSSDERQTQEEVTLGASTAHSTSVDDVMKVLDTFSWSSKKVGRNLGVPDSKLDAIDEEKNKKTVIGYLLSMDASRDGYVLLEDPSWWWKCVSILYGKDEMFMADHIRNLVRNHVEDLTAHPISVDDVMEVLKGLTWSLKKVGRYLGVPRSKLNAMDVDHITTEEKKRTVIGYWLLMDPYASWRRFVDILHEKNESCMADLIRNHVEEQTDSSLTCHSLLTALDAVGILEDVLQIPESKREKMKSRFSEEDYKEKLVEYYITTFPGASWNHVAGNLLYYGHREALKKVKGNVKVYEDPSFTLDELTKLLKDVKDWDYSYHLDIPKSVHDNIRKQYSIDDSQYKKACLEWYLENHPSPTWIQIAASLYWTNEHEQLKVLKNHHFKYGDIEITEHPCSQTLPVNSELRLSCTAHIPGRTDSQLEYEWFHVGDGDVLGKGQIYSTHVNRYQDIRCKVIDLYNFTNLKYSDIAIIQVEM